MYMWMYYVLTFCLYCFYSLFSFLVVFYSYYIDVRLSHLNKDYLLTYLPPDSRWRGCGSLYASTSTILMSRFVIVMPFGDVRWLIEELVSSLQAEWFSDGGCSRWSIRPARSTAGSQEVLLEGTLAGRRRGTCTRQTSQVNIIIIILFVNIAEYLQSYLLADVEHSVGCEYYHSQVNIIIVIILFARHSFEESQCQCQSIIFSVA